MELRIYGFLLLSILSTPPLLGIITSTFDDGTEGWTITGDPQSETPEHFATGGNPGGYILGRDAPSGQVWRWSAPADYHGDLSAYFGGTFSYDIFQSTTSGQFNGDDVIISSGNLTITYSANDNPGTTWTQYQVTLSTLSPWRINNGEGPLASDIQIQSVLANVTELRIRGEFASGSDSGGLDNVSLIPETGFYGTLLGLVAIALLIRRRNR